MTIHLVGRPGVIPDTPPVMELLERSRHLCLPMLREVIGGLATPMDAVAGYHLGWIDRDGRPETGVGGKAVRPALALLSAQAAGGTAAAGVPAAVAVELVHNFSLLHDDLMDGDETRRHRATAWVVFGPALAILTGDALLALATDVLFEAPVKAGARSLDVSRAVRRLATAVLELIDGQARDLSFEDRDQVGVAECLRMAGGKAGALMACAASLGAALAGADDHAVDALERYGYHLGLAFQAVDDVLGIWGAPEVTGKPRWSDLRRRKKSLPVSAALAEGGRPAARLAEALADLAHADRTHADRTHVDPAHAGPAGGGDSRGDDTRYATVARLIEEAGGRAWTQAEARRHHAAAVTALAEMAMADAVRQHFTALAEFVVTREK